MDELRHPGDANPLDFPLSTREFAALNQVQAASVISRLSKFGTYHGIRPVRLANKRLLWPATLALSTKEANHV